MSFSNVDMCPIHQEQYMIDTYSIYKVYQYKVQYINIGVNFNDRATLSTECEASISLSSP